MVDGMSGAGTTDKIPLPNDEEMADIAKSVLHDADPSGLRNQRPLSQSMCEVTFGNGDQSRCFAGVHDQTNCDRVAAIINERSGRTDAMGTIMSGSCSRGSRPIPSREP